ncbi:hypothetical protein PR048_009170, partial [Dryococelus australis]
MVHCSGALLLCKLMNGDVLFNNSTGWLDQWKKRHGICELAITALPNKRKNAKEQITVLACSKAVENHTLPLMVSGMLAKPKAFENLNISSLPEAQQNL